MDMQSMQKIRVWDLPTRLFHWALLLLFVLLFVTAYAGQIDAHAAIGQAVLVLVLFRLVWGFVGSQTSRFRDFVKGASSIRSYLASGQPATLGHNPLGGVMVVALLATLLGQALSGMFASDGIAFDGPFAHWITSVASNAITGLHIALAYVIAGLVAVHVVAVLLHWILRRENLIAPMFSGKKWVRAGTAQPRFATSTIAFAIVLLTAIALVAVRRFL